MMVKCRLCAQEASNYININATDPLTKQLCTDCNRKISTLFQFRQECIDAQILLRNELIKEVKNNSDSYDQLAQKSNTQLCENHLTVAEENNKPIEEDSGSDCNNQVIDDTLDIPETQSNATYTKENYKSKYQASLHPCDTCGKRIQKHRYMAHRNRHLGIRPFLCQDKSCGQAFYSPSALNIHSRDHHTSHKYECEICGKTYKVQKSFYTHKERHKTPRHQCTLCDKRYKSSTHLKEHIRTHTGERPYNCSYCDRSFSASYNFKTHLRSHTKEKPFSCDLCNASYGYRNLLKHHMNKSHPEIIS